MNRVGGTPEHLRAIAQSRLGMAGYARIIASLRNRPQTLVQLAALNDIHKGSLSIILRHCLRAGVVHRTAWARPMPKSALVPVWALGRDGDVEPPGPTKAATVSQARVPSGLMLLTTILQIVQDTPTTIDELAADLCMNESTIRRALMVLRKNKLIHISAWDKRSPLGRGKSEFSACLEKPLPDAPHSGPMPNKEKWRRYRDKTQQALVLRALAGTAANSERAAA